MISADGKLIVLPSDDLFEPRLHLLTVDGVSATVVESTTYAPQVDALFVRDRLLISRLDQDRVSIWTPTDKGLTGETHVTGIPLAASMDVLRRGTRAGVGAGLPRFAGSSGWLSGPMAQSTRAPAASNYRRERSILSKTWRFNP